MAEMPKSLPVGSRWVMLCVMLGTGTVSLNNSSFNPAIVQLMHDFRIGESVVSWVMVIFLLTMSLSLLITGYLSQRFGKRQVYLCALAVFVLSSLLGVFVKQFETVLLVRALHGFASGLMIPLSLGIIFSVTPQDQRGTATGLWGAMIMLTLAGGPMIGAVILLYWHWQTLFLINIPLGVSAFWLGWIHLPKQPINQSQSFDWSGFLLLSVAIVGLLFGLSQIKQLGDLHHVNFWATLGLSGLAGLLFCLTNQKKKHSLIDWKLFKNASFNRSLMISVVHTVGLFISLLLIPLLIQNTLQLSPIWTGILLMSSALTTSLCSKWAGHYLDRHGAKLLISGGMLFTATAFIGLAVGINLPIPYLVVCMVIHGLGFGLSYMPSTTAGLNSLHDQELVTQGAALNNLIRRVCSAVAVVIAALYLQIRTDSLSSTHQLDVAQLSAMRELFFICAVMLFLALPQAWKFPSQSSSKGMIKD
ncbi:DHA2 family efflux MFS transporter permease subunit [Acinetobacter sp. MB5]|uniref:DHA2 family efflux MFS transporter permease subunit n=1 Tax=Acinetobacter sp. MB5 TaxID=2069438 RepID=UPI000DCFDA53|nr:DHA2 family efflux MFS transporter permease subunit [Acinetobacter sp. MB5]